MSAGGHYVIPEKPAAVPPMTGTTSTSEFHEGVAELPERDPISSFKISRVLGRGSFGETYLAYHYERLEHALVLKFPSRAGVSMLRSEAKVLCSLHHPNIVKFREIIERQNGQAPFIVMEYASGGSLEDRLRPPAPRLTQVEVARMLLEVLQALEYIHLQGVLHLDVKPANVLLSREGDALVADFGISQMSHDAHGWAGTRPYMAPEVFVRSKTAAAASSPIALPLSTLAAVSVGKQADMWSAGVLAYEMLTGSHAGVRAEDVEAILLSGGTWTLPPLPKETAHLFAPVISLMLTVDPTYRPDCSALLKHAAMAPIKKLVAEATASGGQVLHQLPPRPPGFVGRRADLERLLSIDPSAGAALVTGLRGMGGIGKTALAVVLAHEWKSRFPDAQIFIDAQGLQPDAPSAAKLMEKVIFAYRPEARLPNDIDAIRGLYHDVLRDQRALIIVDNARDAAQVRPLLPNAGCALIVTSRNSFVIGTRPPHYLGRLPDADAVVLLRQYYGALTDADAASLIRFCAGLPLVLRIVGAHMSLDADDRCGMPDVLLYLSRLESGRLGLLNAGADSAGEVAVSESLRLSEERLSDPARSMWRKLAVFSSSFDSRAAKAVAGADDVMLDAFVRQSILDRDGDRFRIHDLVAEYASAQLDVRQLTSTRISHASHFTIVGEEADEHYLSGDSIAGLALFDRERSQLEDAFSWLCSLPPDSERARLIISLINSTTHTSALRFHVRDQRIPRLNEWLRAALILRDQHTTGRALGNLGLAYKELGDSRKAIEYFEQALPIFRDIGNLRGEGNALGSLGFAYYALGEPRKAIEYNEQALIISRRIAFKHGEGADLNNLGNSYRALGEYTRAIAYFEQSLAIAREIRDRQGEGATLTDLGLAHNALGEYTQAIAYTELSLSIFREIGDRRGEGNALGNIGVAYHTLGNTQKAITYHEQHLVIARDVGDRQGEGDALWNISLALESLGRLSDAITGAEAASSILELIASPLFSRVREAVVRWRQQKSAISGPVSSCDTLPSGVETVQVGGCSALPGST